MGTNTDTSEFLLRACHDLRTPMRGIRAHAELLIKNAGAGPPPDFEQRLGFIADGARQLDLLVDALARYAIALKTDAASFQSTRMDVLLRGALAKLEKALRENEAEVTYDELPRVQGEPDRLMQLFEELVRNAVLHRGESPPRVHISAVKEADGWIFGVRDNGPGVETSERERIFQPFGRLHGSGPGLGLATCQAIVQAHGGRIWAEPGEGFKVCFTLPG